MNTSENFKEVHRIHRALEYQQRELDLLILAQPSGGTRNLLTEANIFLLEAIQRLQELSS